MNDNKTAINPETIEMLKKFQEAAQTAPQGLMPPYQSWPQYPSAPCPSCGHCPHCGRGGYFHPYITYTTY